MMLTSARPYNAYVRIISVRPTDALKTIERAEGNLTYGRHLSEYDENRLSVAISHTYSYTGVTQSVLCSKAAGMLTFFGRFRMKEAVSPLGHRHP